MIKRTFDDLLTMLGGTASGRWGDLWIHGVSTDSRTVREGNLFIPLTGETFDGHAFVQEAFSKGASAAMWQADRENPPAELPLIYVQDTLAALQELARAYRRQLPVRVVGVTGSNGKTTTKDMIASVLATTYKVHKTKGNLNNHIGLPLTILEMEEDSEMAVMEMGMSSRGEIAFLSRLAVAETAVITNIGESHLLQLGSRDEIAKAKLEILSGMKEGGFFVYNGDEPLLQKWLGEAKTPASLLTYRFGITSANDIYPAAVMLDANGTHFITSAIDSPTYFIPLLGQHNVVNALSAIAVGKYMGVAEKDIIRGLRTMQATGMRIELVKGKNGLTILNDAYNASPTSMKAAIELLKEMNGYERKFLVLGDMLELGPQEIEFHKEIGRLLTSEHFDYVFAFGKLAQQIALEAEKCFPLERVFWMADKREIVRMLVSLASDRDVVLVKGSRGMRLEEIVNELRA